MVEMTADWPTFTNFKTPETITLRPRRPTVPRAERPFEGIRPLYFVTLKGLVNTNFEGRSDDWHYERYHISIPIREAMAKTYQEAYNYVRESGLTPDRDRLLKIHFKALQVSHTWALNGVLDCTNSRDIGYVIDDCKMINHEDFYVFGNRSRITDGSNLKCDVRLGAKDNMARLFRVSYNINMLVYGFMSSY